MPEQQPRIRIGLRPVIQAKRVKRKVVGKSMVEHPLHESAFAEIAKADKRRGGHWNPRNWDEKDKGRGAIYAKKGKRGKVFRNSLGRSTLESTAGAVGGAGLGAGIGAGVGAAFRQPKLGAVLGGSVGALGGSNYGLYHGVTASNRNSAKRGWYPENLT